MKLILSYKKNRMDELIKKIEGYINIYDSCMGTGGFLVSSFNILKDY